MLLSNPFSEELLYVISRVLISRWGVSWITLLYCQCLFTKKWCRNRWGVLLKHSQGVALPSTWQSWGAASNAVVQPNRNWIHDVLVHNHSDDMLMLEIMTVLALVAVPGSDFSVHSIQDYISVLQKLDTVLLCMFMSVTLLGKAHRFCYSWVPPCLHSESAYRKT